MMESYEHPLCARRQLLYALIALPTTLALTYSAGLTRSHWTPDVFAQTPMLPPTPACPDPEDVTPTQTDGPYYTRSSPERTSLLEIGMTGTHLNLSGYILSRHCQPLAHVLLDFWQADAQGQYDNQGYRCRGHQFTDEAGGYRLETIVPGL